MSNICGALVSKLPALVFRSDAASEALHDAETVLLIDHAERHRGIQRPLESRVGPNTRPAALVQVQRRLALSPAMSQTSAPTFSPSA
jgi:hypothetical protein